MGLGFKVRDKVKVVKDARYQNNVGIAGKVVSIGDIDTDGDTRIEIDTGNLSGGTVYFMGNFGDVLERVEEEIQENSIVDIDIDTPRQTYKIWEAIEMLSRDRDLIFESIGGLGDNVRLLIVDDLKDGFGATSEYGIAFQFANEENFIEMFVNHFWIKSEWTLNTEINRDIQKMVNKYGCNILLNEIQKYQ